MLNNDMHLLKKYLPDLPQNYTAQLVIDDRSANAGGCDIRAFSRQNVWKHSEKKSLPSAGPEENEWSVSSNN